MKRNIISAGGVALLCFVCARLQAADGPTRFYAHSGSKVRIEGTANMIHTHWLVTCPIIGGYLEAGPGFPIEPGQAATPGKVEAKAEPFIAVRSLRSANDDGTPYSEDMDKIMYEHLKADQDRKMQICFHLTDLTLKEPAKSKDAPYVFEAKGTLGVAGVTNQVTMPVNVLPLGDKKLKISGTATLKMTDFKMEPPTALAGALKTGDAVKVGFEWNVMQRAPAAAASK
jgi:hypothetical protein